MNIDLRSLTGGISIGLDRSGAFAVSASGVAVRDSNGRLKARTDADEFIDVTELAWPLDDVEGWVLRVPVPVADVQRGDLIIMEEHPVRVILVHRRTPESAEGASIEGITADGEVIEYRPAPSYFLRRPMVVKVVSAFELFDRPGDPDSSLPFLALAMGRGGGDGGPAGALLLASAFRQGPGRANQPDLQRLLFFALLAGRGRSEGWLDLLLLSSVFKDRAPLALPAGAPVAAGAVRRRAQRRRTRPTTSKPRG